MNKKNELGIILGLIILTIIRFVGIENIPFKVIVSILGFCIVFLIFSAAKYKGSKKERGYFIGITLLVAILSGLGITAEFLENYYPHLSTKYDSIIIIFMGITFLCLMIVAVASVIFKYSKNKKL